MDGPGGGTQNPWCSQLRPSLAVSNLARPAVAWGQSLAWLPSERARLCPYDLIYVVGSALPVSCLGSASLAAPGPDSIRASAPWEECPSSRAPLAKPPAPWLAACPPWDKKEAWPGLTWAGCLGAKQGVGI